MKLVYTALLFLLALLAFTKQAVGIRFVIDTEECLSHKVESEWDTVHASFVVIKHESTWESEDGVDVVVKGPDGAQVQDFHDKISDKFTFVAQQKGVYKFCFTNKSPYQETIDFDIHVGHIHPHEEHAKDHHLNPLHEQIYLLEEALHKIEFEQHWLVAQTDRQAIVNEGMSKRAMYKSAFEAGLLVGVSALQMYLLRRLFERKLGATRV
ncbi:hypothetical protein V2J09_020476 [Rumex salicifolius]